MPAYRFYLNSILQEGQSIALPSDERHHIFRVMRCKSGEIIEIVNGQGMLATASIENDPYIKVLTTQSVALPPTLILAQAIAHFSRLEMIVEKGTEIGMSELWLFPAEKSEKKELSTNQSARLNNICIAALKQCGRLHLPKIVLHPAIQKWQNLPTPAVFGCLSTNLWWDHDATYKPFMAIIGPEAGLSVKEQEHLKQLGAHGVRLHQHILRTDTAAIVALTLLNNNLKSA